MYLVSGVVNFPEEVLIFISISVSSEPQAQDEQMTSEKNSKKSGIVNSEPFVGSLGSQSSRGRKDGRHESSSSGEKVLVLNSH